LKDDQCCEIAAELNCNEEAASLAMITNRYEVLQDSHKSDKAVPNQPSLELLTRVLRKRKHILNSPNNHSQAYQDISKEGELGDFPQFLTIGSGPHLPFRVLVWD